MVHKTNGKYIGVRNLFDLPALVDFIAASGALISYREHYSVMFFVIAVGFRMGFASVSYVDFACSIYYWSSHAWAAHFGGLLG